MATIYKRKEDKGKPMSKEQKKDIEAEPLIQSGSRVTLASPFVVKPENRFGLQLGFSDGSTIHIMPAPLGADAPEEAEDDALPEVTSELVRTWLAFQELNKKAHATRVRSMSLS